MGAKTRAFHDAPAWAAGLKALRGEAHFNSLYRTLYATDASAYSERPLGVVYPLDEADVALTLRCAIEAGVPIIPRAGGTSLAGQAVGRGLVMDVSKHMRSIIEVNAQERWAWVQPGVVLDELNIALRPYSLFFAPETSTANRCCIGGMVGNNSCGSHSLVYGSTRDHLLEAHVLLADGTPAHFRALSSQEAQAIAARDDTEGHIYRKILELLNDPTTQELVDAHFPDRRLRRRNTGYALDALLHEWQTSGTMNLCKLLAGSEGTLAILLSAKLNLEPLPPPETLVVCVHCQHLRESFQGNLVALQHAPRAVELIDRTILELSRENLAQQVNRFFIEGDPAAVLVVEMADEDRSALDRQAQALIVDLQTHGLGYAYPILHGKDVSKVWSLRKAGLGLLSTMPGDGKPVSLIEDTAVLPEQLDDYIADIQAMLSSYGLQSVYHAHISEGELHIRPVLNLKDAAHRELFRAVGHDTALLVRKYRGSLSGEHGDGRLRGEFIRLLFGPEVYALFKTLKTTFDAAGRLNPGKIVETPPMDAHLRYQQANEPAEPFFDYSWQHGFVRAVEQCNGSGDCRRAAILGGMMCPTFQATHDELYSTRARANALRTALYSTGKRFDDPDALAALSSCLSCKGCKRECPSSVDLARYKAEYLQHHYDSHGAPLASRLIARMPSTQRVAAWAPRMYNALLGNAITGALVRRILGFTPVRQLPKIGKQTLRAWYQSHIPETPKPHGKQVVLFADEFTNYLDVEIGITFVRLLQHLGYEVVLPQHRESGRTSMSKGFLRRARRLAHENVLLLSPLVGLDSPLVGLEPSCILAFRDEYPGLLRGHEQHQAQELAQHALLYDEFLMREIRARRIPQSAFGLDEPTNVLLHGHCHQKALASVQDTAEVLRYCGYQVQLIPSSCCGMAGAFGYEKKNYDLSMRIGEQVLFPTIRQAAPSTLVAAPGTSCRQQILDGTGVRAYHPVELMYRALRPSQ